MGAVAVSWLSWIELYLFSGTWNLVRCRMSLETATKELASLKGTADELSQGVSKLEEGGVTNTLECKILSERITQSLLKVDGLPDLSKSSAAEAVRAKDLKTARELSVLIARRKRLVKLLDNLGDRVDKLADASAAESGGNPSTDDVDASAPE